MSGHIKERLRALDSEYETGQKMLAELETRRDHLTRTLLRIEGARQALREVLALPPDASVSPPDESQGTP
ncbi:hypothetical protein [Archangium primigenium]|uniref:hypothetical protein n=1 Tax=[Archangium] primigenium TaxID=2792470 RepID=UPI0019577C2A|nr:hypothetical protein [Archangium primigenium]MBM7116700.1 hypothetical protein [Archangium primigenium]